MTKEQFLAKFKKDEKGILVYKILSKKGGPYYKMPSYWKIEPGAFLQTGCDPNIHDACSFGVNFSTKKWAMAAPSPNSWSYNKGTNLQGCQIWLCRIRFEDIPGVVVPVQTDGKARCERLELIRPLKKHKFIGIDMNGRPRRSVTMLRKSSNPGKITGTEAYRWHRSLEKELKRFSKALDQSPKIVTDYRFKFEKVEWPEKEGWGDHYITERKGRENKKSTCKTGNGGRRVT